MKISDLEAHILESAKPYIKKFQAQIDANEIDIESVNRTRILFPFDCDGCYDFICYNTDMKKFEYIEYRYGIMDGVQYFGDKCAKYKLEDTEMRKIIL
jgi:hypothetical protein